MTKYEANAAQYYVIRTVQHRLSCLDGEINLKIHTGCFDKSPSKQARAQTCTHAHTHKRTHTHTHTRARAQTQNTVFSSGFDTQYTCTFDMGV